MLLSVRVLQLFIAPCMVQCRASAAAEAELTDVLDSKSPHTPTECTCRRDGGPAAAGCRTQQARTSWRVRARVVTDWRAVCAGLCGRHKM